MDESTTAPAEKRAGVSPVVLGLVLIFGLVVGFFSYPVFITPEPVEVVVEVPVTSTPEATRPPADAADLPEVATRTPNPTEVAEADAEQQSIMDFVLADARHFLGEPDAPVTIVEFSDFK